MTDPSYAPGGPTARPSHVPEDVLAEQDAEERRLRAEPVLGAPPEAVPEDVRAERDLEARLGNEELKQHLTEGSPPAEEDAPL